MGTQNALNDLYQWRKIIKLSAEGRSSTTTVADDGTLVGPNMAANGVYKIRMHILLVADAAADFKFGIAGPASPTRIISRYSYGGSFNGVSGPAQQNLHTDQYFTNIGMTSSSDIRGFILADINIENGANAGNFSFQWAQNTSSVNQCFVVPGSMIEYMRVA